MNLKFNLNTVNTILMVVVLIVVIVACVRKYRENFQDSICYIPCGEEDEGKWTDGDGTQFRCGGPKCAHVSSIDAAVGRGSEFGITGDMIDVDFVIPTLAGKLHGIFLGALDAKVWGDIAESELWKDNIHIVSKLNKKATSNARDIISFNILTLISEIKNPEGFYGRESVSTLLNPKDDDGNDTVESKYKYKVDESLAMKQFREVLGIDEYCGENEDKSFC
jgi:hypothetical protein